MEIETTKLAKTVIESPNIKTKNLVVSDDIIIRNSSLGKIFGGVEPLEERIDVREMLEETTYGAEQIHAFRCDVSNLTYDRFKSVTLRMAPNDNTTNSSTSQKEDVWLFVRCFDEYMNVVNDEDIISIDPVRQTTRETTWEFEPFIILPSYKLLEFRMALSKDDLNTNPNNLSNTLRSANLQINGQKLYIENWKTINQAKGVENFTTDFYFDVLRATTPFDGLMEGLNENELKFNNHEQNNDIHLSPDQVEDIAKIDALETDFSSSNELISTHITDNTIHINSDTKKVIDEVASMIDYVYDEREIRIDKSFDLSPNSTMIKPAQGIYMAQICANHTIEGTALINHVRIPQCTSASDSEYTHHTPLYLVIYGDTTGNDDFELIAMSYNTQEQIKGGEDMIFEMGKNTNIGGYKKYRLFYVLTDEEPPKMPTSETYTNYPRMAFNGFSIDRDCVIWQSGFGLVSNYTFPIYIDYTEVIGKDLLHKDNQDVHVNSEYKSEIMKISSLETTLENISNVVGPMEEEMTNISNSVSSIEQEVESISNDVSDIKIDLRSLEPMNNCLDSLTIQVSDIIETSNKKYSDYDDAIHDVVSITKKHVLDITKNLVNTSSAVAVQQNDIIEVQFQPLHTIEKDAYIKRITISDHTSNSNAEIYLVLYGSKGDEDTFDYICTSNNSQLQNKENNHNPYYDNSKMTFTFDENVNIKDYKKYRIFYARNNAIIHPEPIENPDVIAGGTLMTFKSYPLSSENVLNDESFIFWNNAGETTTGYVLPLIIEYETIEGEDILHKDNKSIHLTKTEKEILVIPEYEFSNVIENDILDAYTTHGFELGNLHIKPGFLKEVKIPFSIGSLSKEQFHINFCQNPIHLAVQIFKNGEDASTLKTLNETHFSENSVSLNCDEIYDATLNPNKIGDYVFTFDNLEIPNDFDFVRFLPTTSKNNLPNGFTIANCARLRLRPIKRDNSWYDFDTDGCKLITGARSTNNPSMGVANYMAAAYFKYSPVSKAPTSQALTSFRWRVEAGNIDIYTAEDLYKELINTHKASVHATVQNYNVFTYRNDWGYGEIESTQKSNYIFDITYPNLIDIYEVVKTVRSNNYEKPIYPKIYPIFN